MSDPEATDSIRIRCRTDDLPGVATGAAHGASRSANALYAVSIRHVRRDPIGNAFQYRSYQWFVDVDKLPSLPWWATPFAKFRAKDHLGDPQASIGANVRSQLLEHGVTADGSIHMLANAAVLGWVFNPVSFFWCYQRDGTLACVLAEVHNTYGQRHTYLLFPDERARAQTEKNFYVSPFHSVDGSYTMTLPAPGARLDLTIALHREGARPFTATVTGNRLPITGRNIARMLVAIPLAPLRVLAQIHYQGVKLWLRRLPVQLRPEPPIRPVSVPGKDSL